MWILKQEYFDQYAHKLKENEQKQLFYNLALRGSGEIVLTSQQSVQFLSVSKGPQRKKDTDLQYYKFLEMSHTRAPLINMPYFEIYKIRN